MKNKGFERRSGKFKGGLIKIAKKYGIKTGYTADGKLYIAYYQIENRKKSVQNRFNAELRKICYRQKLEFSN